MFLILIKAVAISIKIIEIGTNAEGMNIPPPATTESGARELRFKGHNKKVLLGGDLNAANSLKI